MYLTILYFSVLSCMKKEDRFSFCITTMSQNKRAIEESAQAITISYFPWNPVSVPSYYILYGFSCDLKFKNVIS